MRHTVRHVASSRLGGRLCLQLSRTPSRYVRVEPSHAAGLLSCGYRFAWDRDSSIEPSPSHPKAVLGTVGHRICELAGMGKLGDVDAGWNGRFEHAWQLEMMQAQTRNITFGPAERWPGYNLQWALWKIKAREVTARTPIDILRVDDPSQGPEVRLKSRDGRLVGVADVVIRREGGVEIRDFKSGRVLAHNGELEPAYRSQLLLYGVMYQEMFGIWPKRLVIDPLVRQPIDVPADPLAAETVVADVYAAMDAFNAAVEDETLDSLAAPAPGTCTFCRHTIRCEPFWRHVDPSWNGQPRAVVGYVSATSPGTITLAVVGGSVMPGAYHLGGVPESVQVAAGTLIRVAAFELRNADRFAFRPGTAIRLAGPGPNRTSAAPESSS